MVVRLTNSWSVLGLAFLFPVLGCWEQSPHELKPNNDVVWIGNGIQALAGQDGVLVDFESYHPDFFETVALSKSGLQPVVANSETHEPLAIQLDHVIEGEAGREILQLKVFEDLNRYPCQYHEPLQNKKLLACREDLEDLPIPAGEWPSFLSSGEVVFRSEGGDLKVYRESELRFRVPQIEEHWVVQSGDLFFIKKDSPTTLHRLHRFDEHRYESHPVVASVDFVFLGANQQLYLFHREPAHTLEGATLNAHSLYRLNRFGSFVQWEEMAVWNDLWTLESLSPVRVESVVSGAILRVSLASGENLRLLLSSEGFQELSSDTQLVESDDEVEMRHGQDLLLKKERSESGEGWRAELCLPDQSHSLSRCEALEFEAGFILDDIILVEEKTIVAGLYQPETGVKRIERLLVRVAKVDSEDRDEGEVTLAYDGAVATEPKAVEKMIEIESVSVLEPQQRVLRFRPLPDTFRIDSSEKPSLPDEDKEDSLSE